MPLYKHHTISVRLEPLLGRFAFLLVLLGSMTVITDKVHSGDVFGLGSNAHALLMVPARASSSAFVLVAAQNPQGTRVAFTTYDAFVFIFIISLFHFLLRFFTFLDRLWLLLFLGIHFLASVFFLLVLQDHSLEVEGVEEGPLSERYDVLRVDGPDLEGAVSPNDHLAVLRNLCDLGVRTGDCLEEVIFVDHRIEAVFNLFELVFVAGVCFDHLQHFFSVLGRDCQSELEEGEVLRVGRGAHVQNYYTDIDKPYIECRFLIVFDYLKQMSEVADSMLFRQKLYDTFKESGLLNKLKTTLRTNLLQKLQKPADMPANVDPDEKSEHFHLRSKFLKSAIAEYLRVMGKEYSLSIFMAECDLEEEDCLRFNQLSQIINLNTPADGRSFLYRLFEEFGKIKCIQARERSTQTDFDEPLSKKLELVDKQFRSKIDYWKLIPGSSLPKAPELVDQEQRLRGQFAVEKERLKRQLEVTLKEEISKKLENQYSFRLHETQKQHEARLNELKHREKMVLDRLTKQKEDLEAKSKTIREEQKQMINKYEEKLIALEGEYRKKIKELQEKEKDFWKKELELRAKKREYEETIRLVKQKVVAESGNSF